jgi:hypothetical protein
MGGKLMKNVSFEDIYKDVPQTQKEQLLAFRSLHPVKRLTVRGSEWEYLAGGQGEETLALLTGGLNSSEVWFQVMTNLFSD